VDDSYTGTITLPNGNINIGGAALGAVRLGTGMTLTSGGNGSQVVMVSTSNNGGAGWSVTCNGKTIPKILFNGAGGRWTLQDKLICNTGGSGGVTVTAGTLDLNNKDVDVNPTFLVNGGTVIAGTGTITYKTAGSGFTYTSGTFTGGSETHLRTINGNTTNTFAGGGQTGYGTLRDNTTSGTPGGWTVTGANTFVAIAGRNIVLPASTTTTVSGANGLGAAKSLSSSSAGTAATVNLTSTQVSVMRAATLKDITVTPNGHTYALDASTNTSGNTGITFNTPFGWGIAA